MIFIQSPVDTGVAAVSFQREIRFNKKPVRVEVKATALGVYNLLVDGKKIGDSVLAPGWTSYKNRILYQTYDVTEQLAEGGRLSIEVGQGWAVGCIGYGNENHKYADQVACAAEITAVFADGSEQTVVTDTAWDCYTHPVRTTDIYHGETWDGTVVPKLLGKAVPAGKEWKTVPQKGEGIQPQERIAAVAMFIAPNGEKIVDFGQNITGWVELNIQGKRGDVIAFDHAEVLDKNGNFYNANYRSAKACAKFILSGEEETLAPHFTFYGFRYVRLLECPPEIGPECFTAVVVHSEMQRTGAFECGHPLLNQLYQNIIWGQKGNYLDLPTDCPQRDERLGWTGDAQVFCRTAAINYDVERFFEKWLSDVMLEQAPDGSVAGTVPHVTHHRNVSAGWGDAATIVPWEIYLAYGNKDLLKKHFPMMKKWVDYIHSCGKEEFLWLDHIHFGDWLAMDAGAGIYKGATPVHLIASAFYAYSCALVIQAGKALGEDVSEYEELYEKIVSKFRACYIEDGRPTLRGIALENDDCGRRPPVVDPDTQTARVLMLHFGLCPEEDRPRMAADLARMIRENNTHLTTGFLGTPYLLHALSENGFTDLAYDLLLQETAPSWLFSVKQGATTIWEHWDGIMEDGSFWSDDMNSYNHYAYGCVYDWIFGVAAGVKIAEAGYKKVALAPKPDRRLGHLTASVETRRGKLLSHWEYEGERLRYRFEIPAGCTAELTLPDGRTAALTEGTYFFD